MTTLPKEIRIQIGKDSEKYANDKIGPISGSTSAEFTNYWNDVRAAYIAGAVDPYTQLHTLQQENADLKRKLSECMELLNPLLEYGQSKGANIPLGASITAVILARAKDYERLRKALEDITGWQGEGVPKIKKRIEYRNALKNARAALTAQPEAQTDNQQNEQP